jgi:hypothetical protein
VSEEPLALIPNLGGEEGPDWRRFSQQAAVASSARLWQLLFPASARRVDTPEAVAWPADLGPPARGAAFPCLDGAGPAVAWLADEQAHAEAGERGWALDGAPAATVQHVHDKAFALDFAAAQGFEPRALRGLARVFTPAELASPEEFARAALEHAAQWPAWTGGRFTLKPRLGSSGRGRVGGDAAGAETAALAGAARRLAARGGAILEPWLERSADLSVQLHVAPPAGGESPAITVLGSLEQWTTASGQCLGHWGEMDSRGRIFSGHAREEAMREGAAAVVAAAAAVGYTGPCGVDGFAFCVPDDADDTRDAIREVLRPIVELNARFTMGCVAAGLARRALPRVREATGLGPGGRVAFLCAFAPPAPDLRWTELAARLPEPNLLIDLGTPQDAGKGPALIIAPRIEDLRTISAVSQSAGLAP